jgi:hypothetical protein
MSDTRVFDRPAAGRAWFEHTIKDQLDLGRPDTVQIVFGYKITSRTPGRFQTKVITKGVEPVIQAHYKHSKVKQYFKHGHALRTETTVNDPYDFAVNRTLNATTRQQLRSIGDDINDRLLDTQPKACSCAPDPTVLARIVSPSTHDGQPRPPCASAIQSDRAARLPVLLPAPVRRPHEPHPAPADRRADPRLDNGPDDL